MPVHFILIAVLLISMMRLLCHENYAKLIRIMIGQLCRHMVSQKSILHIAVNQPVLLN